MSEWTVKAKNDARNAEADLALIISRSVPRQMSRAIDFIDGVYVCRPPDAIGILHIPRQMLIRSTARKTPTESKETAAETLYETITSPAGLARLQALSDAYARTMTQITAEKMAADLNFRKRETEARNLFTAVVDITNDIQAAVRGPSAIEMKTYWS